MPAPTDPKSAPEDRPDAPSEPEGRGVLLLVAGIFGTVILIFGGIAAAILATQDRPNDVVAFFGGFAWVFAAVLAAMGLAARCGTVRGTARGGAFREVGAGIDPAALEARAWAHEGVAWGGEAEIAVASRLPILLLVPAGLGLALAGIWLLWLGRITWAGAAVDLGLCGFLLFFAWTMETHRRAGPVKPSGAEAASSERGNTVEPGTGR